MRLFMACLIIYGLNLHWSLYVAAFAIVGWQWWWTSPKVSDFIESLERTARGSRLEPSRSAVLSNLGSIEFLSWRTDRTQARWLADLEDAIEAGRSEEPVLLTASSRT
jgi:hypothetical protein